MTCVAQVASSTPVNFTIPYILKLKFHFLALVQGFISTPTHSLCGQPAASQLLLHPGGPLQFPAPRQKPHALLPQDDPDPGLHPLPAKHQRPAARLGGHAASHKYGHNNCCNKYCRNWQKKSWKKMDKLIFLKWTDFISPILFHIFFLIFIN